MADTVHPDFIEEPMDGVAVRVLGSLVEKEFTTPDNYPLSLNALAAASNQTSNRDPVMALDDGAVSGGLQELIRRSLAREVHRSDSRVRRFRHALTDTLHLHPAELAVLCVLLLRGPQTVGEIRSRTSRMFEFIDLAHVEITLQALMPPAAALVVQLPRQPGQKEVRYAHTLSGEPDPAPAAGPAEAPGVATDRVAALEDTVAALRTELDQLRDRFDAFLEEFR